jgi:all-trans-retinol 13,14-reductase
MRQLPAQNPEHFFPFGKKWEGLPLLTADRPASRIYQPPHRYLSNPDAIIIGSGIGGLGLASMLAQRRGMKVQVLELADVPGGCLHMHEIDGFEFNSGIDSLGDMHPDFGRGIVRATVEMATAGQLKIAQMPDAHEVCVFGDDVHSFYSSPERNIEWAERMFPGEGDVRRYYAMEQKIEGASTAWALTKLLPNWMPDGVSKSMVSMGGGRWRDYMRKGALGVFRNELGFSERLAAIFLYMYGNHGQLPSKVPFTTHALTMNAYRHGAFYPVGGPGQIVESLIPQIEKTGGQVAVRSGVERILLENGRAVGVKLENGEELRSKIVVSDASAHVTFTQLLPTEVSSKLGYLENLKGVRPSPAHVHLMLGYDEVLDLPRHIIWSMPTYSEVSKYDLDGADVLYKRDMRMDGPAAYILCPSARDPVYQERYPGKSTVCVLAEIPHEWVAKHRSDPAFAQEIEGKLKESLLRIAQKQIPALRGKTPKVNHIGIPVGCNPRAQGGCSYGLEASGERFLDNVHWLRHKTKIPGLYLTGQDPLGPGFGGSLVSARFAYSVITGDILFMVA